MTEEKTEEKEEKISEKTLVVKELPKQEVTEALSEDKKTKYNLMTESDALTEILEKVRVLFKKI